MVLADRLTSNEKCNYLDDLGKLDMVQKFRTSAHYTHWFLQKKGPMQQGQNPLYSSCKQSIWCRWKVEPGDPHWVNWESTSEYDTECDEHAVTMTEKLQVRVMELQFLEAAQLPGELIAKVVMQVVQPVVAMMPIQIDMDTDMTGAGPESTMGPGMPAPSAEMPLVLEAEEQIRQQEDEEWKWRRAEEPFQHPMDSMDSEDLDNTMEK